MVVSGLCCLASPFAFDSGPAFLAVFCIVRARRHRRFRGVLDDIALFTEISGDRHPLHYDEEAAASSRFGEIVVQGGITSAILNTVVPEELLGPERCF